MNLNKIYKTLLNEYNYQGWWPLINLKEENKNKTGQTIGYHPKDYNFPKTEEERIEIITGAILMQNTSWNGAYKAIKNINQNIGFNINKLLNSIENEPEEFKEYIKPAGYYNQKYDYINNMLNYYKNLNGKIPSRKEILKVKGVGDETADTILLYAYKQKEFIIDTYLKRIFIKLEYINEKDKYITIKNKFQKEFKGTVNDYQEFHALIDEHAKNHYIKKPYGNTDKILL